MDINEEQTLQSLIQDTTRILKEEKDFKKKYLYSDMLKFFNNKLNSYRICKAIAESGNKESFENTEKLFDEFNSLAFAGFDFYHLNGLKDAATNKCATINVLINKDQLKKLENVVNCDNNLFFFSYELDSKTKYGIVLCDTVANINLIPFTRTKNGILVQGKKDGTYISNKDLKEAFGEIKRQHNGFGYRKLTKTMNVK